MSCTRFLSESTLHSCLNVKRLLAQNTHNIWSLSDSNRIWTHNHLVPKQTHNHLAQLDKSLSRIVSICLYGSFDCMLLSYHIGILEWIPILLLSLKPQILSTSSKEFLDIPSTIDRWFTLKRECDMITYSQMHHTDNYSQQSSIIWPVWLNGWTFLYKLSSCGFESCRCHLIFTYCACLEQGVPWHSENYRV